MLATRTGAAAVLCLAALALGSAGAGAGTAEPTPEPTEPAEPTVSPTAPPGTFVALDRAAPGVIEEMRYFGRHNFVGKRIRGYEQPLCLLTREAAYALGRAQIQARAMGYSLKVYDCYRPQRAVNQFVAWAGGPSHRMKREFYPRVRKTRLIPEGYIAPLSGHSRGSTVDLTLVKLPPRKQPRFIARTSLVPCFAPYAKRWPDNSVDMGTGYDCFDPRSHTLSKAVDRRAHRNRLILKRLMNKNGFTNYPREWWHFTLRQEPFADTYFDFPVARSSIAPAG